MAVEGRRGGGGCRGRRLCRRLGRHEREVKGNRGERKAVEVAGDAGGWENGESRDGGRTLWRGAENV